MVCQMCGLDARTVGTLTQITFKGAKGSASGRGMSQDHVMTVCGSCKGLALNSNHVDNKDLNEDKGQQGYMKPSNPEEGGGDDYPSVRPQ